MDIQRFEPSHRELFAHLSAAGWRAGQSPDNADPSLWALPDAHFSLNAPGTSCMVELTGIALDITPADGQRSRFQFGCRDILTTMAQQPDFTLDVLKILGTLRQPHPQDGYPIGEGDGAVLFVREDLTAALIDHSLCGFFRAPDPFILLDWFLLRIPSSLMEHHAVHHGDRISRYIDARGQPLA